MGPAFIIMIGIGRLVEIGFGMPGPDKFSLLIYLLDLGIAFFVILSIDI